MKLTSDGAAAARAVGDGTARVDAELSRREAVIANADLAVTQLAEGARGTT